MADDDNKELNRCAEVAKALYFEQLCRYEIALGFTTVLSNEIHRAEMEEASGNFQSECSNTFNSTNKQKITEMTRIAKNTPNAKSAADVFAACATRLRDKDLAENDRATINKLVDETANLLANRPTSSNYGDLIKELPLERRWARVIGGAALVFLGLVLAASCITLAVASFGVSTPLSLFGITVATNMVVAGLAIGGAALSVGLAGAAGFFANLKTKSDLADKAEKFVLPYTVMKM